MPCGTLRAGLPEEAADLLSWETGSKANGDRETDIPPLMLLLPLLLPCSVDEDH